MATSRMHADERDIDVALVSRLIGSQFPQWAGLPVEAVASSGTDNALFDSATTWWCGCRESNGPSAVSS